MRSKFQDSLSVSSAINLRWHWTILNDLFAWKLNKTYTRSIAENCGSLFSSKISEPTKNANTPLPWRHWKIFLSATKPAHPQYIDFHIEAIWPPVAHYKITSIAHNVELSGDKPKRKTRLPTAIIMHESIARSCGKLHIDIELIWPASHHSIFENESINNITS